MIHIRYNTYHRVSALPLLILYCAGMPPGFGQSRGEIKGTVTITRSEDSGERHRGHVLLDRYATDPAAAGVGVVRREPRPYKISEAAAVYLVGDELSKEHYSAPATHGILDQKGLKFHPQVLPILAGATVDFPNEDNLFHNVFSYSQTREFDLGRYPMGDSRSVVFDRPGIVRVYCDIHTDMSATILVLDNPYFAVPDDNGVFVISNVPEGRYTLNLWYARDLVLHRSIVVKASDTTSVNLVY